MYNLNFFLRRTQKKNIRHRSRLFLGIRMFPNPGVNLKASVQKENVVRVEQFAVKFTLANQSHRHGTFFVAESVQSVCRNNAFVGGFGRNSRGLSSLKLDPEFWRILQLIYHFDIALGSSFDVKSLGELVGFPALRVVRVLPIPLKKLTPNSNSHAT